MDSSAASTSTSSSAAASAPAAAIAAPRSAAVQVPLHDASSPAPLPPSNGLVLPGSKSHHLAAASSSSAAAAAAAATSKRKRSESPASAAGSDAPSTSQAPAVAAAASKKRNQLLSTSVPRPIKHVVFGGYEIKPNLAWGSPYPLNIGDNTTSRLAPDDPPASHAAATTSGAGREGGGATPTAGGGTSRDAREGTPDNATERLFVCDGCFKYMVNPSAWLAHKKTCALKRPPGRKVYQRGAHIIWEVDGAAAKVYCQNLCLFGKLFIETKYIFFDVEGFMFYLITDATPSFDHVLGFFSKEKVSYDDYNLACIVVFPPYQKKGYGTLLIELSYELDRRRGMLAGTPERPLSALGLRGYLAYWTGVLTRYFTSVFDVRGDPPAITYEMSSSAPVDGVDEHDDRARKRARGWEGELPPHIAAARARAAAAAANAATRAAADANDEDFEFPTSLEELARKVHLRPEDTAYALVHSGLAQHRRLGRCIDEDGREQEMAQIIITPDTVKSVVSHLRLKPAVLDRAFLLV